MKFNAQYLPGKKPSNSALQFVLTPETAEEKALIGAAYMLGIESIDLEEDGILSLNFSGE